MSSKRKGGCKESAAWKRKSKLEKKKSRRDPLTRKDGFSLNRERKKGQEFLGKRVLR